jgi:deazaflavin-dependent oxidoreductase (nitroreductase family)
MKLLRFVLLVVVGLAVVFVVGMRTKSPVVLGVVRRMNKAVMNPVQMRSAGTPGAYASIIRHEGRSSRRTYETPVVAVPTEDGFVIALPYGDQADWVKNVLASGTATIVHEDDTVEVRDPELVAMDEVANLFPENDQQTHRVFAVEQALRWRQRTQVPDDPALV